MCELTLYPRRQYTSLPKYLRAVNRVLSVTSERSAFPEDAVDAAAPPLASTSASTLDMTLGLVGQGLIHPPIPSSSASPSPSSSPIATRRPSASPSLSGSPRSSPQVVPLLSPIPWLRSSSSSKSDTQSENGDVDPLHLSSPQQQHPPTALPSTAAAGSELHLDAALPDAASHPDTATPTGGLVDEVDPGSGGAETAEPVALSSAMSLSPERERSTADMSGELINQGAGEASDGPERGTATSLQERFIRASSPKIEMPLDPEEADDRMKE